MLQKWPICSRANIPILLIALMTIRPPPIASQSALYEIKFVSSNLDGYSSSEKIIISTEECLAVEKSLLSSSCLPDTEGNCLELWSEPDCRGNVLYYMPSAAFQEMENVSLADFATASMKLCEPRMQPSHTIVRRGLVENSTEYFFWYYLSKIRGRSEVFLEEFRKCSGHPDWQIILGGINWQGPRSKIYLKALYKVVNVFKTYCDMDMKWSRYTTAELAKIKQLAAETLKTRETKALKFPYTDPQFKVHSKIVGIWKNITITLDRAYQLKIKYDQSVELAKSTNQSGLETTTTKAATTSTSTSTVNERHESDSTSKATDVKLSTPTSTSPSVSAKDTCTGDESLVRIVE